MKKSNFRIRANLFRSFIDLEGEYSIPPEGISDRRHLYNHYNFT